MKVIAILALMLVPFTVACGSNEKSSGTPDPSAPTTTATISVHDATCKRLGRTWVVAAQNLGSAMTLADSAKVKKSTDAMTGATDQMQIEECTGQIAVLATKGNYYAALQTMRVHTCEEAGGVEPCKAGAEWDKTGGVLVDQVKALSAGS